MKIKIFVMAVVWLLTGVLSAQSQSKPCGCGDKDDLVQRLMVVEAAIQEYMSQLESLKAKEKVEARRCRIRVNPILI